MCVFSSRRRHTRCALVTGVQTCALPIWEAPGGVAGQGPDDVDHAVAHLVVERRRLAAELHRGIDLDLDAPVGLGLDLARPGLDEVLVGSRGRRQEVLQAQDHLLRRGRRAREAARSEAHTSELQSLMRISYAVFYMKKQTTKTKQTQRLV